MRERERERRRDREREIEKGDREGDITVDFIGLDSVENKFFTLRIGASLF